MVEVPMVNLLNSILSIIFNKINLVLVVLHQKGQHAKSVENLDIWLLSAIIGWIMLIKSSIHLPSLLQWPQHKMHVLLKISLGLLTVQPLIMEQLASTISVSQNLTLLMIILLLEMVKIYLLHI